MAVYDWLRSYQNLSGGPWTPISGTQHIQLNNAISSSATTKSQIRRMILDLSMTFESPHGPGANPDLDWWGAMNIYVVAGILNGFSDTPLNPEANHDARITLSGALKPMMLQGTWGGNKSIMRFENVVPLDSAGIRQVSVPLALPYASVSLWLDDPYGIITGNGYNAIWQIHSWLRVLYKL